jgi:hypothetical protein
VAPGRIVSLVKHAGTHARPLLEWGAISHAGSSRTGVNDVFAGVVVAQKVVLGAAGPGELFVQPPIAVLEDASHDPMIRRTLEYIRNFRNLSWELVRWLDGDSS